MILKKRKGEEGQALIEFVLVLILLMGTVLFLLQLGLVFGWANYIQYATYLSSRAYVSAGKNKADQKERAGTV
ncbi:MAG: pilus assembly protein, partial [Bdellovibrionales bacterium]|nr:pilus assembly protein [Bdellovibrionales bacterium]